MSVVLKMKDSSSRIFGGESKKVKVSKDGSVSVVTKKVPPTFNIGVFFLTCLVGFLSGYMGYVGFVQYPRINFASTLIPYKVEFVLPYQTYEISIDSGVDSNIVPKIKGYLSEMKLGDLPRFKFVDESDNTVGYFQGDIEGSLYQSHLLFVGHKYWIKDRISSDDISKYKIYVLKGRGNFARKMIESRYEVKDLKVEEVDNLESVLLDAENNMGIGVLDIDSLNNRLQVMELDGTYFFDDPKKGSITYSLGIKGELPDHIKVAAGNNMQGLVGDGFSMEKVAKVNMTGVTAITRGLIPVIDARKDVKHPAKRIADFLKKADIVHVSNEISFVPGCKYEVSLRFCSKPEYIEILKEIGVNLVELTGNHNNDYGSEYNRQTIEVYKENGIDYFGGGLNTEDASKPRIMEVNGNKVAFIGYNYYDTIMGSLAIAGANRAGSNSYSVEKLKNDITNSKKSADIVIVTFQFQECYSYPPADIVYPPCYRPVGVPDQKAVFRSAIDYGADIVVGTQAHQPQTYEIYKDKVIYYGLGNLFFDQINWIGTRQGLVLSHYLYKGRVVQTKVSTTLYDKEMQPYITEGKDRELLLELLKQAR